MTSSGAVGAALLLLCVSATASSSSEMFYPAGQFLDRSAFAEFGVLVMGSNVHGKVKGP